MLENVDPGKSTDSVSPRDLKPAIQTRDILEKQEWERDKKQLDIEHRLLKAQLFKSDVDMQELQKENLKLRNALKGKHELTNHYM